MILVGPQLLATIRSFIDLFQSGRPSMVYVNHVWRLQSWRYCLDTDLNRLGIHHDTRRWLLLLWSLAEEKCPQHDLPQHDDRCNGVVPGMPRDCIPLTGSNLSLVVLLGLLLGVQWNR